MLEERILLLRKLKTIDTINSLISLGKEIETKRGENEF